MYKEKSAKEIFFASFTHDLKTALFRLQLEVEKMGQMAPSPAVESVLNQTRKMQLDLENSLDSTIGKEKKLFVENVNLKNFLVELHAQWPEFHIKVTGIDDLPIDKKAMHSIFKNLLHNSFVHGQADEVSVDLQKVGNRFQLRYFDNGKAFQGNQDDLGQSPRYSPAGSGFGLFIVRQWVQKLGGNIEFLKSENAALEIKIDLPGGTS